MTVKLKDVAKQAGVSEGTASLALNGSPLIKTETRERVQNAAASLGYYPNTIAKGLARRRSGTIGLIVPDIESAYYGKLVRCIDQYVRESGYELILAISNDQSSIESRIVNSFISQRVEGIIIAPINHINTDASYLNKLKNHGIHFVFVTAFYSGIEASCVMVDLEEGSYLIFKHLLRAGKREIYHLCGPRNVMSTAFRVNGYQRAFQEMGLTVEQNHFLSCERLDYDSAQKEMIRLLLTTDKIDAITANNDMMAMAAVNTLQDHGFRVPEDIVVAGYDDLIFASIAPVPITTVRQDIEGMSRIATELLLKIIKGKAEQAKDAQNAEMILLKPELIIRRSTIDKKQL